MVIETIIHTWGDGCYCKLQLGNQIGETQVAYVVNCLQHKLAVLEELKRMQDLIEESQSGRNLPTVA